ncbi:hypothetical protein AGLY_013354 [Aphis glycines]|uniref:Intraflagellar transport protein 46 homolog n=1 Tax=Aphis glycines TaxID=307491 RepID=A0A6G0T6P7_APHGL|nr:hypothetical protein AGLY_013354 [Aphis glycines]
MHVDVCHCRYYPQKTKLEFKLQPFIPDYLPAVGDADAFIKVIAPDPSIQAGLGLEYLDEPCLNQSDPCLLNLQLRASSSSSSKSLVVKKLESAEKNPKVIDQWIRDINELNRGKTSTFFYSNCIVHTDFLRVNRKMPDVETIMEPWMGGSDQKNKDMPDFENADLLTLIDEVCDYFEIPKTDTKIESLHLLFSVYLAIKNSRTQNTTVLASDNSS